MEEEWGFARTVREGYRGAWPADAAPAFLRAFRTLRLAARILPPTAALVGLVLLLVGRSMGEGVTDVVDGLGILALFFMIVLLPLLFLAQLAVIVGAFLLIAAVPLGIALAWALGRLVDPAEPPMEAARTIVAVVGVSSALVSGLLVVSIWGVVLLPVTLIPVAGWWRLRKAFAALDDAPPEVSVDPGEPS